MRIGQGFDVHRLEPGSGVVLGGVQIACDYAVVAHSDGDVLVHALCDAVLGAAGLGDIGRHFPDSDPQFRDADSRDLLRRCVAMLGEARVANADLTLVAEVPKLAPYAAEMRQKLAADLGVDESRINIKATTSEGLGFVGRREGIAAMAVVLLEGDILS